MFKLIHQEAYSSVCVIFDIPLFPAFLDLSPHQAFSWHWWYVIMGIAVGLALIGFIVVYAIILRQRETCFGYVPMGLPVSPLFHSFVVVITVR